MLFYPTLLVVHAVELLRIPDVIQCYSQNSLLDAGLTHFQNMAEKLWSEGVSTRTMMEEDLWIWLPEEKDSALLLCSDFLTSQSTRLDQRHFKSQWNWLVPRKTFEEAELQNLPLRLDSNVIVYNLNIQEDKGNLTEFYKVKKGRLLKTNIGAWSAKDGFTSKPTDKWIRRNMHGVIVDNAVIMDSSGYGWPAMNQLTFDNQGKFMKVVGIFPDVLHNLEAALNFTAHTYILEGSDTYGGKGAGGNWTGIVGELVDAAADVSSAGLTVTPERAEAIHFTRGVVDDKTSIWIHETQQQDSGDLNVVGYLSVFPLAAWALATVTAVVAGFCYFFLDKVIANDKYTWCHWWPSSLLKFFLIYSYWQTSRRRTLRSAGIFLAHFSICCRGEPAWTARSKTALQARALSF